MCLPLLAQAQRTAPVNGPHHRAEPLYAFTGATLHPLPDQAFVGTLLVKDGRILRSGRNIPLPPEAIVVDLKGRHIWPAFIESYSDLGVNREKDEDHKSKVVGARSWNPAIHPAVRADALYRVDKDAAAKLRAQGFGMVVTHAHDGIMRGTGAAVLLADRSPAEDVLLPRASSHFSFDKGSSKEDHPSSLMGSIALIRQTLYDAAWYAEQGHMEQSDVDLEALNELQTLPLVFEAKDRRDVLRIHELALEFGLHPIVKGQGDEFARVEAIAATGRTMILPLAFPKALDVADPFAALEVPLATLREWELAPFNPGMLAAAGVPFAFTTRGLKDPSELWAALRMAVRCGLDTSAAIAAFTTVPATLFNVQDRVGSLAEGMQANFMITSEHLLSKENTILSTWVAGIPFEKEGLEAMDLRGTYDLNLRSSILKLMVGGKVTSPTLTVRRPGPDSTSVKVDLDLQGNVLTLSFDGTKLGMDGPVRLNGIIHRQSAIWDGQGQLPSGEWIAWSAVRQKAEGKAREEKKKNEKPDLDSLMASGASPVTYPLTAFGTAALPDSSTLLFRHATVWTNGPEGLLRNTDVLVHQGRIKAVGRDLDPVAVLAVKRMPRVREVDATGMHLTAGIVDEHSHIAISRGVNEGTQSITAEVRIGDVIDPDDVDIYRHLAGGVTAVQLLHGSANPIGGQSAIIKLRWGQEASAMKVEDAPGFIKFALGENVKRSSWGGSDRFPRTRMGVEQVMFDGFHRARTYKEELTTWQGQRRPTTGKRMPQRKGVPAPRRDLELEALAEILEGERFITCHSYVQSEIAMLLRVADSMGFRVNTFTHILEGYKVADRLQRHGASASTFSDWWAYKFEVNEAIPYNAALLWGQGVNTGINSDDAEMGRRLNQEAAKTIKYGSVPPEEAWKMVTLNPARMLHLDHRMGSVRPGMDADLVLWSADPLTMDARAMMTVVDGMVLFEREDDAQRREVVRTERERIIAKMLLAKQAGAPTEAPERKEKGHWHCESIGERP